MDIFNQQQHLFPYHGLKFPGQHTEERILFVTREGKIILKLRLAVFAIISFTVFCIGIVVLSQTTLLGFDFAHIIPGFVITWFLSTMLIIWWIYKVYQKTIFIITTRRLTKFIHTTPWSRYQMSLGIDHIVDTGAYQKGWLQIITGLGYFVARSSAGAVKNFKIINISFAEDLHNYLNKLLYTFNEKKTDLDRFRPFIPHLKGEARDEYVRKVAPKFAKPKKVVEELDQANVEYISSTSS